MYHRNRLKPDPRNPLWLAAAGALGGGASNDIDGVVTPLVWYKPYTQPDFSAGSPLASLTDYGSKGANATQALSASRATAQADGSLLFDGIDDKYTTTFSTTLSQPFELFLVLAMTSIASTQYIIDGVDSSDRAVVRIASSSFGLWAGTAYITTAADTNTNILGCVVNGSSSELIKNGVSVSGSIGNNNTNGLTIGTQYNGVSFPASMKLYELFISAPVTADQRAAITDILNTRWSVY